MKFLIYFILSLDLSENDSGVKKLEMSLWVSILFGELWFVCGVGVVIWIVCSCCICVCVTVCPCIIGVRGDSNDRSDSFICAGVN